MKILDSCYNIIITNNISILYIIMNFKRLLNTEAGHIFISLFLGLGLATLFRKACNDKNCLVFKGPVISDIDGKTFKKGDKCYKYKVNHDDCDANKRIVVVK